MYAHLHNAYMRTHRMNLGSTYNTPPEFKLHCNATLHIHVSKYCLLRDNTIQHNSPQERLHTQPHTLRWQCQLRPVASTMVSSTTQCCGLPLGGSKPARARDVESRPRSGMHALQYASCTQITPRCRCDRKPPPLLETHTHPTNDVLNRDVPAVSDEKTNLTTLVRRPHVSKPKHPTNDALTRDVPVLVDGKANLMPRILHSATTTMS
jgi:hypothetical protein